MQEIPKTGVLGARILKPQKNDQLFIYKLWKLEYLFLLINLVVITKVFSLPVRTDFENFTI